MSERVMVPWPKVERLLEVGNRMADALDALDLKDEGVAKGLGEWDRARYALAPEQEQARRGAPRTGRRNAWELALVMPGELKRRFIAWAEDVKRRGDAGEFGRWPWQKGYDEVGLWGRRRRKDEDE